MNNKAYFVLFGLVSLGHIMRVLSNWSFIVGEWTVPMWTSWLALFAGAAMCVWAISLATR